MLTVLLLYLSGYDIVRYVSYEGQVSKYKASYYESLEQSSSGWHENKNDYVPVIINFLQIIYRCFKDLDESFTDISLKKAKNPKELRVFCLEQLFQFRSRILQRKFLISV